MKCGHSNLPTSPVRQVGLGQARHRSVSGTARYISTPVGAKNLIVRRAQFINIARLRPVNYLTAMFNLTRQQQMFLCSVLLLLLVGWTVRAWRIAHPPERSPMTAVR